MAIPIIGDLIGKVVEAGDKVLGRFIEDKDKRREASIELEKILHGEREQLEESYRQELQSKERIIVAELQQSDNYTKRARPTILYTGVVLVLVEVIARYIAWFSGLSFPTQGGHLITTFVPAEFWIAWGGISGTYVIGRSAEKRAKTAGIEPGKITRIITG